MVCVCDCSPTIDIYPSSLQSWTLSAAAHSFTELVQHVFVTMLFSPVSLSLLEFFLSYAPSLLNPAIKANTG